MEVDNSLRWVGCAGHWGVFGSNPVLYPLDTSSPSTKMWPDIVKWCQGPKVRIHPQLRMAVLGECLKLWATD